MWECLLVNSDFMDLCVEFTPDSGLTRSYWINNKKVELVEKVTKVKDDRIVVGEKLFGILEAEKMGCQYSWLNDVMAEIVYEDLEDEMPSIVEIATAIEQGYKLEVNVNVGDVIKFQTVKGNTRVRVVHAIEEDKIRLTNGNFLPIDIPFEVIAKAAQTEI